VYTYFFPFEGVYFSSGGLVNKYIAGNKEMTWSDARQYCRSTQGDLATVTNTDDLNLLINVSGGLTRWIGLSDRSRGNMNSYANSWKWSYTFQEDEPNTHYMNFADDEPDIVIDTKACVAMGLNGYWYDGTCSDSNHFVCFTGKRIFRINVVYG